MVYNVVVKVMMENGMKRNENGRWERKGGVDGPHDEPGERRKWEQYVVN